MLFVLRKFRQRNESGSLADLDDGELIARAQQHNAAAFNELIERHRSPVYSVALRYMGTADMANDVTQDAFLRAWQAIDTFQNNHGVGFRSWLMRIASNRALDLLRASRRRPSESLDAAIDNEESNWSPEDPGETPVEFAERDALATGIERSLLHIPPDQRLAIILSDIQGYSYDEIAEITGVAPGTVKSRIHRGRARLREVLLESGELSDEPRRLESDGGLG